MKKFKLITVAVVLLSLLVTLCACNTGDDVDHSFDTTTRAPGGDIIPNDTTTDKIIDNVPPSPNPNDTTAADQGDDTTTAPDTSKDTGLTTDGPNDFGELHPPTPKE